MNRDQSCPGIPETCEHSQALVARVLDGVLDPSTIEAARQELGHCAPCLRHIDVQVQFKVAMAQKTTEQAPASLQLRITESLGRVDLSSIDVTDL